MQVEASSHDQNDAAQWSQFIKSDKDAACYVGNLASAKYFMETNADRDKPACIFWGRIETGGIRWADS